MEDRTWDIARLWTLAQPAVSAFVGSIVRDFRDRDDVLQEVAVAVIDSFQSYDPSRPFVAWAIGVARNHVRNYLRGQKRDRHVFSLESEAMDSVAQALLFLVPPVRGESAMKVLGSVIRGDVEKPEDLERSRDWTLPHCPGDRVPVALSAVAMRALEWEQQDRYQSVTELQREI